MGKIYSSSLNSVKGTFVVDIRDYDESVHSYLIQRGAIEWGGWISVFATDKFKPIHFPGSKPVHHGHGGQGYSRLFFPDEDEALLFMLAHGEKFVSTHIRKINDLVKINEQTNY